MNEKKKIVESIEKKLKMIKESINTEIDRSDVVFENDKAVVVVLKNMQKAIKYCKGTHWDIGNENPDHNYFNQYYRRGANLYVAINKQTGDKIAVKVDPDNSVEYFSSDDRPMPNGKKVIRSWGIPHGS